MQGFGFKFLKCNLYRKKEKNNCHFCQEFFFVFAPMSQISNEEFSRLHNELLDVKQKLYESQEREKFFQSEVLKSKQQLKAAKGT